MDESTGILPASISADNAAGPVNYNFPICRAVARLDKEHNGGNVTRPRAADDFAAIRTRMEELRRERASVPTDDDTRRDGKPNAISDKPRLADRSGLSPAMRRGLIRVRTA